MKAIQLDLLRIVREKRIRESSLGSTSHGLRSERGVCEGGGGEEEGEGEEHITIEAKNRETEVLRGLMSNSEVIEQGLRMDHRTWPLGSHL